MNWRKWQQVSIAGRRGGFTLIEAALVTVIVGVGVLAMLQLLAAGTMSNAASTELTTGLNLANNVREMTQKMSFEEVKALHGTTYSPPINAQGEVVADFGNWSQSVAVRLLDPGNVASDSFVVSSSPMARVTVSAVRNGRTVCETSWLIVEPE